MASRRRHRTSDTPKWLKVSFCAALVPAVLLLVAAFVSAQLLWEEGQEEPPVLYARLLYAWLISFGVMFALGVTTPVYGGRMYSVFAGGTITRKKNPVHFWIATSALYILALAIAAFGVWKMLGTFSGTPDFVGLLNLAQAGRRVMP